MLPKIAGALDAAKSGVNAVHIIDGRVPHAMLLEILTDQAYGTMIRSHWPHRAVRRSRPMPAAPAGRPRGPPVWLFDLDDTLHDATRSRLPRLCAAMGEYIERELGLSKPESDALRRRYWQRYGATLLGLVRHHGVKAAHFLHHTHLLPGLEQRVRGHAHDLAALAALPGRKYILTNAPRAYALRVLGVLGLLPLFDGVCRSRTCDVRPPAAQARRPHAAPAGGAAGVPPRAACWWKTRWQHQKAARRVGMKHGLDAALAATGLGARRADRARRPPYVDCKRAQRARLLRSLRRRLGGAPG
jgi:putative hydrolase of the HAD superfamily